MAGIIYTAPIVDEIHVSTGRWWNDTATEEVEVPGHTPSQYNFVEHIYQRNSYGLNSTSAVKCQLLTAWSTAQAANYRTQSVRE